MIVTISPTHKNTRVKKHKNNCKLIKKTIIKIIQISTSLIFKHLVHKNQNQ